MHGFHIDYIECAHYFVDIDMGEYFPLVVPSMSKNFDLKIFHSASINSFLKLTWILRI